MLSDFLETNFWEESSTLVIIGIIGALNAYNYLLFVLDVDLLFMCFL